MRASDGRSGLPKIEKIHLPEKHMVLRVVLLTAAIIVAAVSLISGLTGLLNQQPGWQEIEAQTKQISYSQEFTLRYHLGGHGATATVENKTLSDLYSRLLEQAYQVFDPSAQDQTVHGLRYLSDHANETVSLEPVLWQALKKAEDSRYLFLAPAYVEQQRLFRADTPEQAQAWDPSRDPELRSYLREAARFASDPASIDLELLADNRAVLHVSQAYRDFAEENEIEYLLDFGWMRNAFICDWIASEMESKGLTQGILASRDGFTRNLDPSGETYSQNLFARSENLVNVPGALEYTGPMALAQFRSYPLSPEENQIYAVYPDGRTQSRYLSLEDGLCRTAAPELLLYGKDLSCGDLALLGADQFIRDSLDEAALKALPCQAIYIRENRVICTDSSARFQPGANGDSYQFVTSP